MSHMQLNAFFPSLDIGSDPAKIRDWAQAAEELGYAYIEVPDHVFGATARDGWGPLYNEKAPFHETFVALGFLAAVTRTIRLSSGILIAPQRQPGPIANPPPAGAPCGGGRVVARIRKAGRRRRTDGVDSAPTWSCCTPCTAS